MAAEKDKPQDTSPTDADMAAARQWFQKARALVDTKSYDYAIEAFINGLERWPQAVEEGYKPLYYAAMMRAAAGGKKPGTFEAFKYPTSGKDLRKALLNAVFLMAKDPKNPVYLEPAFRNAVKLGFDEVAMWLGQNFFDACQAEKKPSPQRYRLLADLYEEIGERQDRLGNESMAIEAMKRAVAAMERLCQVDMKNLDLSNDRKNLQAKLHIIEARLKEDFTKSIRDAGAQADLRDRDREVQADERMDQLVAKARADVAANPDVAAKVFSLVDLLCKREQDRYENEAVETLLAAYHKSDNYAFKMRADDIRMRQLNRKRRELLKDGDREGAKKLIREQLRLELGIFQERVKQYPTDLRIRFEFGLRLFRANRFDDAIPVFQEARNDPKVRTQCNSYIGRCFYEKGYYDQAIDVINQAVGNYELQGDDVSKDLQYWLGRSHEAAGHTPEALKAYGQVLQWDYNYRDVRERMDNLRKKQ